MFCSYSFYVTDYPDYSAGYNYDGMAIKEEDEEKYRPEKDGTNGSYEGNYSENYWHLLYLPCRNMISLWRIDESAFV